MKKLKEIMPVILLLLIVLLGITTLSYKNKKIDQQKSTGSNITQQASTNDR